MRFARRATDSPDRAASTSNSQRDLRISDGLILWTIQKYEREELQEQMSLGSVPTAKALATMTSLQTSLWTTKQKFASELSRHRVIDLVSPYKPGSPGIETQVQSWHRFMLLDLVPLGVLEVALSKAAEVEKTAVDSPVSERDPLRRTPAQTRLHRSIAFGERRTT